MNEESLFAAALEKTSPGDRLAFLDEVCVGDARLRQRLDLLLTADDRARGILDRGQDAAAVLGVYRPEPALAARQVFAGRFTLGEKLGEGGMGEVWGADQIEPVRRRVALKVIRPGLVSAGLLARFDQERQTLALMDHPNVGKVLDAGVVAGRPYFVLEIIEGVPITRYCDEARLSVRERLELFVPVCHAVQHAHQKGIIHRDLKPSNILVPHYDGKPVPKVIDFGIAKASGPRLSEPSVSTEVGALVGTLEYMSPEQAEVNELDIDTRSDIYSLGVLLYELLTGSVPFTREQLQAASFPEMLRIIKEVEPPAPSARLSSAEKLPVVAAVRRTDPKKLVALVRGELDWIVMKCLEKDRSRRYETAEGLAMDLQRYLADEPVLAGPPSTGYRLRRYARKYRKVLATAGAFATLLVAATLSSIGLASRAQRERNHAEVQKQSAEANFKRALEAVDQMLTRVAEAQLLHVPQMEPVRRNLLQDALRFYQELLLERGDSLLVRSEAASAYRRVGQIQVLLGQRDEGEEAYRQAVALLEALLAESPDDPTLGNKLAGVHNELGLLYLSSKRWPQAEAAIQQAVALMEELDRRQPTILKHRLDLAKSHNNLVVLYRAMGRLDRAEKAFLECAKLLDSLLAGDPKNVEYLTLLATCHQNAGLVYRALGRTTEAEAAGLKALALNQQLVRDHPQAVEHRRRLAGTHNNLGLLYTRDNQHAKAEEAYKQSLALNEAIHRDHPKVVEFMVALAGSYGNMATHVRSNRSPEESLEWSARTIHLVESVLAQDPRDVIARMCLFDAFMGRGQALLQLDRREEAAKDWRRMLEVSAGHPHINMRLYRPSPLARLGEHVQATAEIETLLAEGHVQGFNLYNFASLHSLCSEAAANDTRLPPAERVKLADKYGGRAVALLGKARAAGYFQSPDRLVGMQENKNLDAIRSRPDFQRLLVELEKKAKPDP